MQTSKPVLIEAGVLQNGAPAFTVQYKNRFLYSKYNPTKNIVSAIEKTEILPGTLVFVFSPCLFYGIETLIKKCGDELGKSVFIVAIEAEQKLLPQFLQGEVKGRSDKEIVQQPQGFGGANDGKNDLGIEGAAGVQFFPREYLTADGVNLFLQNLTSSAVPKIEGLTLPVPGILRRAIRFDFSGGVAFNADFYNQIFTLSQNAIAQFWKNRLTLVKLGRLYCKNIFKNLPVAAGVQKPQGFEGALKFENLEKTVSRPILVLGAGESLWQGEGRSKREKNIIQLPQGFEKDNFFIIAVDAALSPLLAAGIVPNAVVASEAQLAIEKAYIGATSQATQGIESAKPILFCDLTSRHTIPRMKCFEPCFFFSEFEKNNFTERLKQKGVLPRTLPPLGSVGITATYIATLLRASDDVPIYVSGLDFSFSLGKTHANGTMAHKERLLKTNRLNPLANYGAAFALGAEKIIGKNGEPVITTKNLFGYAILFRNVFSGIKNIFDCGASGVDLGIQATVAGSRQQVQGTGYRGKGTGAPACGCGTLKVIESPASSGNGLAKDNSIELTRAFLEEERSALPVLADILTNGENAQSRDKAIPYNEQILQLLKCREYLFLHFPDGAVPSLESSFLNRVRTQIDFFNKEIISSLEKISPQK